MHSIVQTDDAKTCTPSAKQVIASGGKFPEGKTMSFPAKEAGKMWIVCGVPGHCEGGMKATLIVEAADGAAGPGAPAGPGGATPSEGTPAGGTSSTMATSTGTDAAGTSATGTSTGSPAAATGSASRNYNSLFTSGLVFSSMCLRIQVQK
jgi:hypothetical protein